MGKLQDKNKVVLGMSGGVDSATAALLLKEQGFAVTAFWFDVLGGNDAGEKSAREAAEQLGIPFYPKVVATEFKAHVIDNFCNEYAQGRTPNPCIVCNPNIKFKFLLDLADEIEAYHIATGHYARTEYDEATDLWRIKRAVNEKKDQSYMLYRLEQEAVSRLLLPLEGFSSKEDIRCIARKNNLENADLKDSQEICFIPDGQTYMDYIKDSGLKLEQGDFIDSAGRILGKHQGLVHYTIGQRKGLGITFGKPVFVTAMDPERNTVTLGSNEDLFTDKIISRDNFFSGRGRELPEELEQISVTAKIRYTAKPAKAVLHKLPEGRVEATFAEPQRAATPGQSIVFYLEDAVVGGGLIEG